MEERAMKTNFRFLALSAAILSMFTACQREELEQNQKPEALTHSVTFVAGAPETKTTVDISDEETAKFAWTDGDKNRISVYENGKVATKKECRLADGVMTIMAEFEGSTAPENASYVAVVNKSNATQIMSAEAYDEDADILVSKAVSSFDGENGVKLQFKREVAIAKMTLKGLDAGEVVNHITVSSTADISGNYGIEGWTSTQTSLDIYSALAKGQAEGYSIVANNDGNAVVWFTCIPQDNSTLTVQVEANDGNTYRKEFGRGITLSRGNVKSFGVGLQKIQFSEVQNTITWTGTKDWNGMGTNKISLNTYPYGYSLTLTKASSGSTNPTVGSENDCRQYANGIIEISNAKPIKKIVFNLSEQGLKRLASITSSVGTVATQAVNDKTVTWTASDDKTTSVTFTVGPTAKYGSESTKAGQLCFSSIDATYLEESIVEPELPQYSIECMTTTGGILSTSETSAHANSQITLIATPEPGYAFNNNWAVTNVETSETIAVTDGSFKMPASDVKVSGTFSKIDYAITKTESDRGSIIAKKGAAPVETAQIGDEITLSATPKEGYEFISWTVVDSEENPVEVVDDKFTMPASKVTVSATFNSTAFYTVSFSVNGNVTTKSCKEEEIIVFPADPEISGVKFMGWTTAAITGVQAEAPTFVETSSAVMGTKDITYYAVFAKQVGDSNNPVQTLAYDTWTYSGSTTNKSNYRLFHSGSYIESAEFDLSTLTKVVVYGGTFGGTQYNKLTIGDGTNTWKSVTVSGDSQTGVNTYTDGTPLKGKGKLRITSNSGSTSGNGSGVRISKVEIYALGYSDYCTNVVTLSSIAVSGTPTKTEYTVGESFDPAGLTVKGTYSDDSIAQISDGISWTCTPSTFEASGNRTVSVTATVKSIPSAAYNVNVTVKIKNTLAATDKSIKVNTNLDVKTLFTTNSDAAITYTLVDNPNVAGKLSGTTFSATAAGTYTVKASQDATTTHSAADATATITVTTAAKKYVESFSNYSPGTSYKTVYGAKGSFVGKTSDALTWSYTNAGNYNQASTDKQNITNSSNDTYICLGAKGTLSTTIPSGVTSISFKAYTSKDAIGKIEIFVGDKLVKSATIGGTSAKADDITIENIECNGSDAVIKFSETKGKNRLTIGDFIYIK